MISRMIVALQKILDENGDQPMIGIVGSSGTPYEIRSTPSFSTVDEYDLEIQDYLDLQVGDNYVRFYLGN